MELGPKPQIGFVHAARETASSQNQPPADVYMADQPRSFKLSQGLMVIASLMPRMMLRARGRSPSIADGTPIA